MQVLNVCGTIRPHMVRPTITPLERIRRAKGLSMLDLADLAGVSQRTIGNLETGKTPQLRTALKIADALGCSLADLFDGDREEASA